jgi:competence protein ComGC
MWCIGGTSLYHLGFQEFRAMIQTTPQRTVSPRFNSEQRKAAGFTLVELLTVVFIIVLLIGILVPSLSAARTAAKKAVTAKTIKSVEAGLEMFRQDNEKDFAQTNGYPPSFSHPPIRGYTFDPREGEFPFLQERPTFYGAMWLSAMLMGGDGLGYIKPQSVPGRNQLNEQPYRWYTADPLGDGKLLERAPFYMDPSATPTRQLKDLPGRPPEWWASKFSTPLLNSTVVVDAFDYPILYYAAQTNGRPTNMVADERDPNNNYSGGVQQRGVPFYFHEDNHGFTGHSMDGRVEEEGWDFNGHHPMAEAGGHLDAVMIADDTRPFSFARYIIDRKLFRDLRTQETPNANTPLRPVNSDSYLLISPGPDGKWGTTADVSNMPAFFD